jgi:hypothetical protein
MFFVSEHFQNFQIIVRWRRLALKSNQPYEAAMKDIVQPKKRGAKSGTNPFSATLYTIADSFHVHIKG